MESTPTPQHIQDLARAVAHIRQHADYAPVFDHAVHKIMNLFDRQPFKQPTSQKGLAWLRGRAFCYEYERNKLYYAARVHAVTPKTIDLSIGVLHAVPTRKGTMYIYNEATKESQSPALNACFTAHFFDRYKERLDLKGTRAKTVLNFLRNVALDFNVKFSPSGERVREDGGVPLFVNYANGIGLGTTYGASVGDGVNVITTFISASILTDEQRMRAVLSYMPDELLERVRRSVAEASAQAGDKPVSIELTDRAAALFLPPAYAGPIKITSHNV
jgi:hypothetical protein